MDREDAESLSVLIAAGTPALRAGLAVLLAQDTSIGICDDPDCADSAWPDVLIADVDSLADEALAVLAERFPDTPVLIISSEPAGSYPELFPEPGGVVSSDIDGPTLAAAIAAVAHGLVVASPGFIAERHHQSALSGESDLLTPREREVLQLLAEGLPNKAIARRLGISEHTAKFHVGSLFGKLGASSRAEAVTLATRRGLLVI